MNEINSKIDFNLFVVLKALYTHGSTTEAAESLYLSQSAVSHALGRLRTLFDDPLFERKGHRMAPTALTRSIMADVEASLHSLQNTVLQRQPFSPESSERQFDLGFRDALEFLTFPALMQALQASASGIRLSSHRVEEGTLEKQLTLGKLDIAVDLATDVGPSIEQRLLCQEPLVVLTRREHRLCHEGMTLEHYAKADHVLVSLRRSGFERVDRSLKDQGLTRKVLLHCQHYFAACKVVADTDMIMTMPYSYAHYISHYLPIHIHRLPFAFPPLNIFMYWHRQAKQEPANAWLRDTLCDIIQDKLPPREGFLPTDPT